MSFVQNPILSANTANVYRQANAVAHALASLMIEPDLPSFVRGLLALGFTGYPCGRSTSIPFRDFCHLFL